MPCFRKILLCMERHDAILLIRHWDVRNLGSDSEDIVRFSIIRSRFLTVISATV